MRSLLGFASYYRRFIPGLATLEAPLTQLTEKGKAFVWTPACQEAFEGIQGRLSAVPVLAYPLPEGQFVVDTDASGVGIGAVLSKMQDGVERPISYASKSLNKALRAYCTTRQELLAVVDALKHFRPYIWGRKFKLRTDHASLRWLTNFKDAEGIYARWLARLETYDYEIEHRTGAKHANADAMSRLPVRQRCSRGDCGDCGNFPVLQVQTRRQRTLGGAGLRVKVLVHSPHSPNQPRKKKQYGEKGGPGEGR